MNIYNDDILALLFFAALLGVACGVLYDAAHAFTFVATDREKAKSKKVFCALEYISVFFADLLFCLFFGACALILMYNANKGVFRSSVYILMLLGFALYRVTISKIVRAILSCIRRVLIYVGRIIFRILSIPLRLIFRIYHLTIGKIVCIIIGGIRKKRKAKCDRSKETEIAICSSGKDEYVSASEAKKKERIFIGRKDARA